jgi:DNA-directed RNA polymerase subunit RPC12/RpoP
MGRIVSGRMVSVPGRWLFPPPRSPLLEPRSSIGYPCRRQSDNTIWSQVNLPPTTRGNTMPSINSAEYWSPPRRKILRVVAVRPTKRDWAAPAEPRRTQKPQLLCARCGRTWEPRQYILRSGRLPKRCPHCASPRWNQPYVRRVRDPPALSEF